MVRRAYVDIPEGQIHYQTEGNGETIILLHQTPLSSNQYSDMIPILGRSYRVIAMDTPGYGNSFRPSKRYEIMDYARCFISFMNVLGIDKANVVGDHTGASIAAEAAVNYPERLDKLILCGCPHYEQDERKAKLTDPRYAQMEIKKDGSHLMKIWKLPTGFAPRSKPESWHRVVVDYLVAGVGATDAWHAVFRYDIEPRFPLIRCPTLLISGDEDLFLHRLETTAGFIPRCRTKIIEGGGDVIAYERYEAFAEAILEFVVNPKC